MKNGFTEQIQIIINVAYLQNKLYYYYYKFYYKKH